jgi:LEA14-like dessication related protein
MRPYTRSFAAAFRSTLPVCLLAVLLGGCAALDFATPSVSVVGLDLERIGLRESTFVVVLRVENPNPVRLPLERGVYTFFLGGERVGRGVTRTPLDIPARGASRHEVAIELDNLRLLPRLRNLLDSEVGYRIEADHYVRGFASRPLRSVSEGELDLASSFREERAGTALR